jgi:hypothetical protein
VGVADFGKQNFNLKTKFDMEHKTSINHENGRLLPAALRVKLLLANVNSNSFVIPEFHFVPRKNDLIDVLSLIDEKNYSDEELDKIYSLSWSVWYVNWGKDEFGFFAQIVCEGE